MRTILIVLCLGILSLQAAPLYAHSPEKVTLSYDQNTHSLTVEVVHPVTDPKSHYVDRIEISKNGEKIMDKDPICQDTTKLSETYPLTDVKSGDAIKVTAFCNRGGDKSGEVRIS